MRVAIHDRVEPPMPATLPFRLGKGSASILLCVAPKTLQAEAERIAALLGLKQIAPSELHRFKGLWPRAFTQPLPEATHA